MTLKIDWSTKRKKKKPDYSSVSNYTQYIADFIVCTNFFSKAVYTTVKNYNTFHFPVLLYEFSTLRAFFFTSGWGSLYSPSTASTILSSKCDGEPSPNAWSAWSLTIPSSSFSNSKILSHSSGTSARTWHGQRSFSAALRFRGSGS